MMLSTRLFTIFLTFVFIFITSELADARTIQKKGRNYFESAKRVNLETDLTRLDTSLTLRILDQMKHCIYARLQKEVSLNQQSKRNPRIDFISFSNKLNR